MINIKGFWFCHECKYEYYEKMPQWSEKGLMLVFGETKGEQKKI